MQIFRAGLVRVPYQFALFLAPLAIECSAEPIGIAEQAGPPDGPAQKRRTAEDPCIPDGEGSEAPELCNGRDDNCDGYVDRDLVLTDCAKQLIDYVGILARAQARQTAIPGRTAALGCPPEEGFGEGTLDIFSYAGPLPVACNHLVADDCRDPQRQNFWVNVVADRRRVEAYSYQVMWGSQPAQYSYYGACSPDGMDGPGSKIPKRLLPVSDANGDGKIEACAENHVPWVGFETGPLDAPQPVLIKDIIDIRNPRIIDKAALNRSSEELTDDLYSQRGLVADVKLASEAAPWQTVRVAALMGTPWLRWKDVRSCP